MTPLPKDAQRIVAALNQESRLLEFTQLIARLVKDGERDDSGEVFIMENDDAVDTVHSLISQARGLLGIDDPPDSEDEDL